MFSSANEAQSDAQRRAVAPNLPAAAMRILRKTIREMPPWGESPSEEEFQDEVELVRRRALRDRDAWAPRYRLALAAAIHVVADLIKQGWRFETVGTELYALPPSLEDKSVEREVKQAQLVAQRNEQLREPGAYRFVQNMERSRRHKNQRVSIFTLMRDGRNLLKAVKDADASEGGSERFRAAIDPYLQVIEGDTTCTHTGMRLADIWRYFRCTWSNPYQSVPGRSMLFLVRDRAAPFHPIIGLGALSSAAVKLHARDHRIGWEPDVVLNDLDSGRLDKGRVFRWMTSRTSEWLDEIFKTDLVEDGLLPASSANPPSDAVLDRLNEEARRCREVHNKLMGSGTYKKPSPNGEEDVERHWEAQARTPLFRSKRAAELAELWTIRGALHDVSRRPPREAAEELLSSDAGRRVIARVLRRAKARSVGTCIADLTVCGAVPPYNHLLGGKLVAMLAASPEMVAAYRKRYGQAVSVIASSMAGRPIVRSADLGFIGTTSLYGIRPCQYDRISIPGDRLGGRCGVPLRYEFMSRTKGWGTFHFGRQTTRALAEYMRSMKEGARVNYVFGEGANPRLRALREGLERLGFDEESLLMHGNRKLIYGVPLIENLRDFLLGLDTRPRYRFSMRGAKSASKRIASWWMERWLERRLRSRPLPELADELATHNLVQPVAHGARVRLPDAELDQEPLFPFQ